MGVTTAADGTLAQGRDSEEEMEGRGHGRVGCKGIAPCWDDDEKNPVTIINQVAVDEKRPVRSGYELPF